jgi:Uncharacterized protein conserved in archaea
MVMITLIGEAQARIGNRFYYIGPLTECKECKLKGVCFNLEPGHLYEVKGLRDAEHDCAIHESKARVVEVEKVPIPLAVNGKKAIEGSKITFETMKCDSIGCENYGFCHPWGIKDGMKLSVSDIIGDLDCPKGEKRVLVKLT